MMWSVCNEYMTINILGGCKQQGSQAETVINVQQAIMGMVQHVQLVVTEELPHLGGG